MALDTQVVTADKLLEMLDEGFRYELVRGELKKMSPSGRQHGKIAIEIGSRLHQYVKTHNLGEVYAAETGFKLASNPDTVLAPDAAYVCQEKVDTLDDTQGFVPGPPDLAVEVISPNDTYTEVEEKSLHWLESGVKIVVVVDPRKKTVTVYRSQNDIAILSDNAVLDGGDVVPGWQLPIQDLFT